MVKKAEKKEDGLKVGAERDEPSLLSFGSVVTLTQVPISLQASRSHLKLTESNGGWPWNTLSLTTSNPTPRTDRHTHTQTHTHPVTQPAGQWVQLSLSAKNGHFPSWKFL